MAGTMDLGAALVAVLVVANQGLCAVEERGGGNQLLDFEEIKVCIGTNGRMSVPSNREHHYRNLRDRYTNCTYVDGNLELTWLQDLNLDLSFLEHIREVTGYVLVSHVDVNRIVLPRLQIVRGRTLFKMAVREEEFALLITLSKMHSLEMPALRDVIKGSVGLFNNYNLCHIKTINWQEIMSDTKARHVYVYNFTSQERNCSPCHQDCVSGCWGPGRENCQKFSKEYCSPQCFQGRCFGNLPRECCHLFCAGGCTGPTQADCIACKNFYDDGICVQECPSMQSYNPATYAWDKNPYGKYAYGATCVKKCPEHLLTDNGACVRACPPNKKSVNGECVPCDGPCPKTCQGDVVVHAHNIKSFQGCTVIEGYLHILENTIKGFQQVFPNYTFGERYPSMSPSALEVFSTVKEITGHLNIQAYDPDFRNLSYFRNLEVIGGRSLFDVGAALYIVKTSLVSLELRSLRQINMGSVTIVENEHLCFAEGINWTKIQRSQEQALVLQANCNRTTCERLKLVCNDQCSKDGCWGVGSDQCLSCAHFRLVDKCLENCSIIPGIYHAENSTCKPCHEECGDSCHGPGANNCTSCKNFKDGPFCVPKCPSNKYGENGVCRECHPTCIDGCTGPRYTVGPGGCNSCEIAILYAESADSPPVCLLKNETCPDGYFLEWVGPQVHDEKYLRLLGGKSVCRKCHPRCKKCTGYGFHALICQECTNYKRGEQCEDECPSDHFTDGVAHECRLCHEECRGCVGPSDTECVTCQNYRVYDGGEMVPNATFKCVSSCPLEYPHRIFPDNSDSYCSDEEASIPGSLTAQKDNIIIITVCVLAGILILVLAIVFVLYHQRREKMKENAMKMTMALTGLDDNEPLRPSNVLPNVAKLRIIKETEIRKGNLLGQGAFGTVYKGVWVLEGENPAKIPVAIKVLKGDAGVNTSKEFLSEAYIMASVDHPNLLQLLAVCMTSEMMLVTQLMPLGCLLDFVRKRHDKIGSKALLNWCTQIARGMSYLEEKRLVHRDLAARNVLVQTPSCVKITDFGLAKLLDINEEGYKADGGKMPIKWLALECIQHRIFTHKSDVWAFGVTVWELLTFGGKPYDNVPAKDVPELLEKGERLPQPPIASIDVYMIIVECWMLDAEQRPCFKRLEDDFSKMARDPGRYLAIPGDKLMKLPNVSNQDDRDNMIRSLASALDSPELFERDEYLQPKSRAPISLSSASPSLSWKTAPQLTSGGASSMYQNNFNQKLLRYGHPSGTTQSDGSVKMRDDVGSDEYDSGRSQAQVGTLKLELPLDEDDYLMPSPQQAQGTSYLDLVGSKHQQRPYQDSYQNEIDNPVYLINDQMIGLPTVSEFVQSRTQKGSEEESDHEYYNDIDRLQREMQPLQKTKGGGAVV